MSIFSNYYEIRSTANANDVAKYTIRIKSKICATPNRVTGGAKVSSFVAPPK